MSQVADFARYLNIRSALYPVSAPDGRRVAFLTDITGTFQVWSVGRTADGQWPLQLTFFDDKVWELHGSPASPHLLAVGDVGGNERQQFYLISNYGLDETGAVAHTVRRLTTDDQAIHRFGAWRSDGDAIIYTCNARNGVDFDLYSMELATGETRLVASTPGNRTVLAWSPDAGAILMLDAQATGQNDLYLVDAATGAERMLTAGLAHARYLALHWSATGIYTLTDRTQDCGALCRLDPATGALEELLSAAALLAERDDGAGELELLAVAPGGTLAAVSLNVEGYSLLYTVDLATGAHRALDSLPRGVIANLSFSADGSALVCDFQSPRRNPDVYWIDLPPGSAHQLTFSNHAGLDRARFVAPELVHFPTFDGRSIPALLYQPARAPGDAGSPCILYVHGGPAGQQRPDFDVRFQYFLSRGYALMATNVRGSTGYGRTYMGLDDLDLRMDSVADLQQAVLWLQQRPEIDRNRIAIYGRSYGGFMVLAAMTEYPDLFAAGIDVVGIANWETFLERTSVWRRADREREYGSLEHHRDLLRRISPIHRAERISAPLLVVAGDNDPRVPLFESEQVVARVAAAGGTVDFIHYADEGHRISKLANRIDSFTHMAAFLDRYLT